MSLAQQTMKTLPVEDAIGCVLCHDITRIIPGEEKGPVFRKGHTVRPEDVPVLLNVGKENIYIYAPTSGILHENEAAERISKAVAGSNIYFSEPAEGRINFHATCQGLLQVHVETLTCVNSLGDIALATLHTLQEVGKGQAVGGTRVIPLLIEEEKILQVEALSPVPFINVLPFKPAKVGIVTTGSEVFHGRIKDAFGSVLHKKFESLGSSILAQRITSDDALMTSEAIQAFVEMGADMIVLTGGMSVDPDDRTPTAIRMSGANVIVYGAPCFPGAMFLLAKLGNIPVLGIPGCVMYHKASIFDLIVPRLLAGLEVSQRDIAQLGHGGFCAGCEPCRYPVCPFGKG